MPRPDRCACSGSIRTQTASPSLPLSVRSESPESLKKRKATFMDPDVVRARKGEFREIAGQRFAIMIIQGEYTAMTVVADRYTVLFFGTADRTILFAHIVSTDFSRIGAVK